MVHHLWHIGISPWEKAVRTVAVYGALLVLLRVFGKRGLAQLNAFDLVVLLLLSNVVQNAIIGNDLSLSGGVLGAAILLAFDYLLDRLAFLAPRLGRLLQGTATTLYADGKMNRQGLQHEAITENELVAALRRQGLELDDVEDVQLEPEGVFNATPKQKPGIPEVIAAIERLERRLGSAG
ncbi:MAG TPA: YetF domain-containing protein [Gaiellaceae bacterium]